MKYLNSFKLFEKLNQIHLLLEYFNSNDFYNFYNNIKNNIQTNNRINIFINNDTISNIIDLNDKNLLTIKDGKHIKQIKPSKLIDETDPNKLENFTNIIKSFNLKDKIKIEEISGENCQKYFYQKQSIKDGNHFLKSDCMRFEKCQDYWKLFEKNPDKLSILYIFQDGLENNGLGGFTLLFNVNGQKYYDKIYGYNNEHAILLENYCIINGYKNCYQHNTLEQQNIPKLDIKLKEWVFNNYPYMDTFRFLDVKNGILSNYQREGYTLELKSTEGKIYLVGKDGWQSYGTIDSIDQLKYFISNTNEYLKKYNAGKRWYD